MPSSGVSEDSYSVLTNKINLKKKKRKEKKHSKEHGRVNVKCSNTIPESNIRVWMAQELGLKITLAAS